MLLCYYTTILLYYSTTLLLYYSTTLLLHYSTTPLLHYCTILHYNILCHTVLYYIILYYNIICYTILSLTHQRFRRVRAFGVQSLIKGKRGSIQAGKRQRESRSSHRPGSEHETGGGVAHSPVEHIV